MSIEAVSMGQHVLVICCLFDCIRPPELILPAQERIKSLCTNAIVL